MKILALCVCLKEIQWYMLYDPLIAHSHAYILQENYLKYETKVENVSIDYVFWY